MKIDYLKITSPFKNLENVFIDFDERKLMTVIVGRNGSGKSNVLEAIVSIFRNLDLGKPPLFSFEIRYKISEGREARWIVIKAKHLEKTLTKQYDVKCTENGKTVKVAISNVIRDKKSGYSYYLPNYIFSYYSGPSKRLEKYFIDHQNDYYRGLLADDVNKTRDLRALFYAKPYHSQFVLLSFFLNKSDETERKFLKEQLGIKSFDSVHLIFKKPHWASSKDKDDVFWGARGVVRDFLDLLLPHCIGPVKVTRNDSTTLTGGINKNEFLHLYIPNVDVLREIARNIEPKKFFKLIESAYLSDLISEIRIKVNVETCSQPISFNELSEGEQQLLTVIGLLKFTGGKDSLFILDEPDTHLNPSWAVDYLKFLKEFIPNHEASHLLMVTHQPLAIANLEKDQLQVMWNDSNNQVHAQPPFDSPRGLGYSGILTSDMFGLKTTLDETSEDLIRDRRDLIEKKNLTKNDLNKLKEIDHEIKSLKFSTAHWDAEYQEYLQLKNEVLFDIESQRSATPTQIAERKKVAKSIIKRLLMNKKGESV